MHDVITVLNSLEVTVQGREKRINASKLYYDGRYCIVGASLIHLGVSAESLAVVGPLKIDYLYERDLSPVPLTLGAMLVYRAAQRTQDGLIGADRSWGAAFDHAVVAASRVIDLLPDSVVSAARAEMVYA